MTKKKVEQKKVYESLKHHIRNTMFGKWFDDNGKTIAQVALNVSMIADKKCTSNYVKAWIKGSIPEKEWMIAIYKMTGGQVDANAFYGIDTHAYKLFAEEETQQED